MIEEPRIYSVEKTVSSMTGVGETERLNAKECNGPLSYTVYKINSKRLKA